MHAGTCAAQFAGERALSHILARVWFFMEQSRSRTGDVCKEYDGMACRKLPAARLLGDGRGSEGGARTLHRARGTRARISRKRSGAVAVQAQVPHAGGGAGSGARISSARHSAGRHRHRLFPLDAAGRVEVRQTVLARSRGNGEGIAVVRDAVHDLRLADGG